jgi:hypothetical protein
LRKKGSVSVKSRKKGKRERGKPQKYEIGRRRKKLRRSV